MKTFKIFKFVYLKIYKKWENIGIQNENDQSLICARINQVQNEYLLVGITIVNRFVV